MGNVLYCKRNHSLVQCREFHWDQANSHAGQHELEYPTWLQPLAREVRWTAIPTFRLQNPINQFSVFRDLLLPCEVFPACPQTQTAWLRSWGVLALCLMGCLLPTWLLGRDHVLMWKMLNKRSLDIVEQISWRGIGSSVVTAGKT